MQTPGLLATFTTRGPVVQLGQGCREVKRDGTAGLVGCWIRRPPKAAPSSRRVCRMPWSRLTKATAGTPASCGYVSDQRHNLAVFSDTDGSY